MLEKSSLHHAIKVGSYTIFSVKVLLISRDSYSILRCPFMEALAHIPDCFSLLVVGKWLSKPLPNH